ncbi:hypothetical protein, partial [Streptococcus pneumoniae]|uniref:hypothetical protein n=1 Tax=Streptococcus pneumoniae TaxID=1313 RepID=UPI001E535579
ARDEVVKLRQMLAAARNTIADLQQARDAALLDLNLATAKVGASARARDALMRENGELRAELDAAFRRAPGVGGWVIVA